jgi:hypothetical protein
VGANPYFYFTPFEDDINAALQKLRQREFAAGRYDPAMQTANPPSYMFMFRFPPNETSPHPGAQHASIEEAIDAGAESGTGSILDIYEVASEANYGIACPLTEAELTSLFGSAQPSRNQVEAALARGPNADAFWGRIERGQARYIIVYVGQQPSEILFAGYSWD